MITKPLAFANSCNHWFYFLARLSRTDCTEGLIGLSLRCMHPSQQHGRRIPSLSSLTSLLRWSFLVSLFLTKITQHIHSLRASGVRSSHAARAALSEAKACLTSPVILCTVPPEICILVIGLYYNSMLLGSNKNTGGYPAYWKAYFHAKIKI
jgi:hypothetical protein